MERFIFGMPNGERSTFKLTVVELERELGTPVSMGEAARVLVHEFNRKGEVYEKVKAILENRAAA